MESENREENNEDELMGTPPEIRQQATANAKRDGERTPCAQTRFYFYSHYYPYPQRQIHYA
jgi:hypothetical protein